MRIFSLYASDIVHSSAERNLVPICTPAAPITKAAAACLPMAMPPAAMTGRSVASTISGVSTIVVSSPTWPPLSPPSAISAEAPSLVISFAIATEATTGMTFTPFSFHAAMYFDGFPAPVVTTLTFSSAVSAAISSAYGLISMIFTPNGLSVRERAFAISWRTYSAGALPAPMIPRPPPSETAAARRPSAIQAIPPWRTGYFIPRSDVIGVSIMISSPLMR